MLILFAKYVGLRLFKGLGLFQTLEYVGKSQVQELFLFTIGSRAHFLSPDSNGQGYSITFGCSFFFEDLVWKDTYQNIKDLFWHSLIS